MIFPRPTVRVEKCLSVVSTKKHKGEPVIIKGYIIVDYRGKDWKGHRLSYHLNIRKIPRVCKSRKSGFILHTCDHKWCIEPEHIYLGTSSDNIKDMYKRHPTAKKSLIASLLGNKYAVGNQNRRGIKHKEESKLRMSISHTGLKCSETTKAKMSDSQKKRVERERTNDPKRLQFSP